MQDFEITAMPKVVPPELMALPDDELVLVKSNICGIECEGQTTANELRDELKSIISRQDDGFLTISEAAQLWADAAGAKPREQRKKLWREIERGTMKAFDDADRFEVLDFSKSKFSCLVRIDDLKAVGVNLPFMAASFVSDATLNKPALSAVPEPQASPEPVQAAPANNAKESPEQRQARRYQMCIDAGLKMPDNDYAPLPRGIGELARREGITRPAFSEDLKKHINRLNGR